ncbi:MAG: 50S ribosomal protein L18 [Nitrosopumilaceae archaeon]|nr:MAG: 50S ribosomal protein L18 [Marine Group I thaumarchaeote]
MTYSRILRRLREKKTNYRRRKALLMSRRNFVTVHISNENTSVQIHKPELTGDKVIASAHSRILMGKGWKGSRKNIPAAYLTGYIAGKKALLVGSKSVILYSGTRKYTQRMAAALKGLVDAGLQVPANEKTFPSKDRIQGKHLKITSDFDKVKSAIDIEVKSS